jgi:hypothetical protein
MWKQNKYNSRARTTVQQELRPLLEKPSSVGGGDVWSIQWYQETYLEISWEYPFKRNNFPNERVLYAVRKPAVSKKEWSDTVYLFR